MMPKFKKFEMEKKKVQNAKKKFLVYKEPFLKNCGSFFNGKIAFFRLELKSVHGSNSSGTKQHKNVGCLSHLTLYNSINEV